jgi:hypothetical protein
MSDQASIFWGISRLRTISCSDTKVDSCAVAALMLVRDACPAFRLAKAPSQPQPSQYFSCRASAFWQRAKFSAALCASKSVGVTCREPLLELASTH